MTVAVVLGYPHRHQLDTKAEHMQKQRPVNVGCLATTSVRVRKPKGTRLCKWSSSLLWFIACRHP
jgi:hypothetical protein